MEVKTFIDLDQNGQNWPLMSFGPIKDEAEARAMLVVMCEFFSQRFGVPAKPLH